jgi:hypothetical protein
MTRIYVDGKEIPPPAVAFEWLEELITHVETQIIPSDALIRHVEIDGHPLLEGGSESNTAPVNSCICGSDTIEVFTGTLPQIAGDSIKEALDYLQRVETAIPSIASSFQILPGPEAFEQLKQLLEGFYWLNLLVRKLSSALRLELRQTTIQGSNAGEYFDKFTMILNQLVDSQERQDNLLIADLLEYEILPLMPAWKELFGIMGRMADTSM